MKRLTPEQDAFGAVLLDYLDGKQHAATVIERDDGFFEAEGSAAYFAPFRSWFDVERQVLRQVRGRVLDVGVGAGRVALELQQRGHEVLGIDVSPLALRVARKRGVKHTKLIALDEVDGQLGTFDTVVMFMNNFGLLESETKAKQVLRRLHDVTSERGRIVATTVDGTRPKREHRAYRRRNLERGRMPGQIRYRLHYRLKKSPWFDWLFVSQKELEPLVRGTGWHVRRLVRKEKDAFYALVLDKDSP
ncbi:MAG TPA: methyltransferase domain-containing protein [Gaiellaceae bacterium]|nr:methyltransferase domain-containing protein [Gaiellaceae bacterium]